LCLSLRFIAAVRVSSLLRARLPPAQAAEPAVQPIAPIPLESKSGL